LFRPHLSSVSTTVWEWDLGNGFGVKVWYGKGRDEGGTYMSFTPKNQMLILLRHARKRIVRIDKPPVVERGTVVVVRVVLFTDTRVEV
jgi:hypothetical protein